MVDPVTATAIHLWIQKISGWAAKGALDYTKGLVAELGLLKKIKKVHWNAAQAAIQRGHYSEALSNLYPARSSLIEAVSKFSFSSPEELYHELCQCATTMSDMCVHLEATGQHPQQGGAEFYAKEALSYFDKWKEEFMRPYENDIYETSTTTGFGGMGVQYQRLHTSNIVDKEKEKRNNEMKNTIRADRDDLKETLNRDKILVGYQD